MTTFDPFGAISGWSPSSFPTVIANGDIEVGLVVGSASKVEVVVDSGLQSYINTSVGDQGQLSITFSAPCEDIDEQPKVTVTSPSLPTTLSATHDAQIKFPTNRRRSNSNIEASVESMTLTATSEAKIELKKVDVTETLRITVQGDAKVDTDKTVSPHTYITAMSHSQVQGGTTTALEVGVSGDSQVKYTVTGAATGSVTGASELKFKVKGGPVPDYSAVTKDSSSKIKIDYD